MIFDFANELRISDPGKLVLPQSAQRGPVTSSFRLNLTLNTTLNIDDGFQGHQFLSFQKGHTKLPQTYHLFLFNVAKYIVVKYIVPKIKFITKIIYA